MSPSQSQAQTSSSASPDDHFFHDWFEHGVAHASRTTAVGDASRYHHSASRAEVSLRHFLAARKYRNHHKELWRCRGPRTNSSKNIEVILVAPRAYIAHNNPKVQDGFGAWSFLVKYRLAAANEEHGNYILPPHFCKSHFQPANTRAAPPTPLLLQQSPTEKESVASTCRVLSVSLCPPETKRR